ncbi:pyridoxal phosphate-dependent aminotransferase [Albibacterium sp.]|uniref:pyridoxal phosphate-dependent aminotransferase n=1 Tax=Albibacterium sp. TaxID=2952885 RepID=UPI002B886A1F|nr:aminotransferase class I/II-fold pyridoxal phosphate-dependent enzyme [Albibacterium sp.]HUH17702.1 aminotransferase class I/II-fold pyridoxal phosphate-dependent enzyme [Albibacterium sp.]
MHMKIADRLQHTEEYYFSKKLSQIAELNKNGIQVLNLGIGSPDLKPPAIVIDTLIEESKNPHNHAYQKYNGIPALRNAISTWYDREYSVSLNPETEILPLMGSKEGIMHICMTYLQPGDEALVPNPGYPSYLSAVRLSGATPISYELKEEENWLPDLAALSKSDLSRVKLMWINYPHMPSGAKANRELFQELIAFAKENQILLCHDNPYSFILNDEQISILSIPGSKDVAIELNSFSKTFNMAGWRIGMLLGAAERISEVLRFKSNMDSGMFYPLQMAASKALSLNKDWYTELNQVYRKRREKVYELLDLLNCTYDKNQVGMFMWAKIADKHQDSYALADEILDKSRVFITPGGIFGSQGIKHIRISLCAPESVFTEAIKRITLSNLSS